MGGDGDREFRTGAVSCPDGADLAPGGAHSGHPCHGHEQADRHRQVAGAHVEQRAGFLGEVEFPVGVPGVGAGGLHEGLRRQHGADVPAGDRPACRLHTRTEDGVGGGSHPQSGRRRPVEESTRFERVEGDVADDPYVRVVEPAERGEVLLADVAGDEDADTDRSRAGAHQATRSCRSPVPRPTDGGHHRARTPFPGPALGTARTSAAVRPVSGRGKRWRRAPCVRPTRAVPGEGICAFPQTEVVQRSGSVDRDVPDDQPAPYGGLLRGEFDARGVAARGVDDRPPSVADLRHPGQACSEDVAHDGSLAPCGRI